MTRRHAFLLLLLLLATLSAPLVHAQHKKQGAGMEEFEEVDPYTLGERERMDALGYVAFAPFPWNGTERTVQVRENMGGVPTLFVETAHFRILSTLGTYEIPNDREEKARFKAEIGRLKKKLGRIKVPKKKVDPWLRLHIYAQRAEELYSEFCKDFGLTDESFPAEAPFLGRPHKLLLVLCQRKSEFARYTRKYYGAEYEYSLNWGGPKEPMFFGANVEILESSWGETEDVPFDSMLYCRIAGGLASNFVDGYRGAVFSAPRWFTTAIGHVYIRRFDARYSIVGGRQTNRGPDDDSWRWEPRVRALVKNAFYAKAPATFAWQELGEMNVRDHMVVWSKLEYLMNEAEGDRKAYLEAMCAPPEGESVDWQAKALQDAFGITPEQLDKAWSRWVSKTYKKR
ncbi:MAG: hypothetical protein GY711_15930 [bacterium]|nr:hypothetical protein [bacterium]